MPVKLNHSKIVTQSSPNQNCRNFSNRSIKSLFDGGPS